MPGHGEAAACQPVNIRQASREIEHPAALFAMKVMVMGLPRKFVDRGASRKINCRQPTFFEQPLDVPVNGGDSQPFDIGLRGFQDLLRRKRPIGAFERFPNRAPLASVALILARHLFK